MSDENVVICMRINDPDLPYYPHKFYIRTCSECGEEIRLSHNTMLQSGVDAKLVCTVCQPKVMAELRAEGEPIEYMVPSDYVLKSVAQETGRPIETVKAEITEFIEDMNKLNKPKS